MLKLIHAGHTFKKDDGSTYSSSTSTNPTFHALTNFAETKQSGYVERRGPNKWRLYMSNTFVVKELQNEVGKHYFWEESFEACIERIESLSLCKVFVKQDDTTSLL